MQLFKCIGHVASHNQMCLVLQTQDSQDLSHLTGNHAGKEKDIIVALNIEVSLNMFLAIVDGGFEFSASTHFQFSYIILI